MTVRTWFRRLFARPVSRPTKAPARSRPAIEALEDRTLLNSYLAGTVAELIQDIGLANQAGGPNKITLSATPSVHYTLTTVNNTTTGPTACRSSPRATT
jgi:hypothetical protein